MNCVKHNWHGDKMPCPLCSVDADRQQNAFERICRQHGPYNLDYCPVCAELQNKMADAVLTKSPATIYKKRVERLESAITLALITWPRSNHDDIFLILKGALEDGDR